MEELEITETGGRERNSKIILHRLVVSVD